MEKKYTEKIGLFKLSKLLSWRGKYSENEYPYKVAVNLLYDLLLVEKIWTEIHNPFNSSLLHLGNGNFKNFNEAHGYILNRIDNIAIGVRTIVISEYKYRNSVAGLDWSLVRHSVIKAQNGDNKELQEIESKFFSYTCGVELIYAWLAYGLLGLGKEEAFSELTGEIPEGIDYRSCQSLLSGFGKESGIYYKPLTSMSKNAGSFKSAKQNIILPAN
jgi:hypothetical protein